MVTVSEVQGVGTYQGIPIGEQLTGDGGSNYPPLHEAEIRVTQYLTKDIAPAIFRELDTTGALKSLAIGAATISVKADAEGARATRATFSWPSGFIHR